MKKFLKAVTLSAAVLALAACGDKEDDNKLVIGAGAGIHDIILEKQNRFLKKKESF